MTRAGRSAAILVLAVLAVASCTTSTSKGNAIVARPSGSTRGTRIWAFSDARLVQPASGYAQTLQLERSDLCQTAEVGSKPVTADQALATLQATLEKGAGPGAFARLGQTKVGSDAKQAETVAVAEIAKANPGGALAALLLAHKDEPQEPVHLENAGVVAVSIGYPQEALALFAAAEQLPASFDPGMGVDRQATMLDNRAYALIRLGRYSDAIPLLKTAIAREPLLAEAQRNLSVALTCLGQMSEAGSALRAGMRRNQLQDLGDPTKPQAYNPAQVFDLSHGVPTKLPDVTYPQTLDQAAGAADKFESDRDARQAQSRELLNAVTAMTTASGHHAPLTTERIAAIVDLAGNVRATPEIAQLYASWQSSYKSMGEADQKWTDDSANENQVCSAPGTNFTKCYDDWCSSSLPPAHTTWLKDARQADKDLRAWADAYSRFTSGLAANLLDPAAHQYVLTESQFWLTSNYALQIGNAAIWISNVASLKGECFDQVTDSPAETKDGGKTSGPDCSAAIGGVNFTLDLEVFSISISCEELEVEAEIPDAEGGFAEAGEFVSVGHKFKTGSTTVFAGAYAKTKEINGLSAGGKGGLYATWDNQGNVVDVGVRAEGSIDQQGEESKGNPNGSTSLAGKDVHWSFVGAADDDEG